MLVIAGGLLVIPYKSAYILYPKTIYEDLGHLRADNSKELDGIPA